MDKEALKAIEILNQSGMELCHRVDELADKLDILELRLNQANEYLKAMHKDNKDLNNSESTKITK